MITSKGASHERLRQVGKYTGAEALGVGFIAPHHRKDCTNHIPAILTTRESCEKIL